MAELIDTMFWQEACTFVFHKGPILKLLPMRANTHVIYVRRMSLSMPRCATSHFIEVWNNFLRPCFDRHHVHFHSTKIQLYIFSEPCKYACNFVVKECPSACPGV
jgi:hypothetical protein